MEEHCMVISGEWVCDERGKWDFVIAKNQMARMVGLHEDIRLTELECNVLKEFRLLASEWGLKLTYWSSSTIELATGIRTPPVEITSDDSVGYFMKHFKVTGGMNLFATFSKLVNLKGPDIVDDSGMGFVTPDAAKFQSSVPFGSVRRSHVSSAASKTTFMDVDDMEFVREAERVEESLKGDSSNGKQEDDSGFTCEGEETLVEDLDERDLRPRCYDRDFWSPLLNGDFGGSDSVNVVYNEEEILDGLSKKGGPRQYKMYEHFGDAGGCLNSSGGVFPERGEGSRGGGGAGNGSGGCGESGRPRKLEEVDVEEFDIPPLFDDTEYESAEIPDLDVDEGDYNIHVGKVFGCKSDCQISLAIYAIKNQFQFKQTRTRIDSFVVQCPDERCDWRVTAHEVRGSGYYEIRKAQLDHSCPYESRMGYKSRATSKVIAAVYKARFGDVGSYPVPRELQRLVLEDLRVNASYMKCYRAKEEAIVGVRGTEEDAYLKLPVYLHMLKLANPGTVVDLETEPDDDGDERFVYCFVAFGASISGFRKLRHVLVIDGTHLSGKYKGVLLTASGHDANFQIFPLAYAVVDCENEEAWTWFLERVERILVDSTNLSIISDRAPCLINAVKVVYPKAKHGACIVHLARNVNSKFSSKRLAKMVTTAAMAYTLGDFRDEYANVRAASSACGMYLTKIGVARWSRANFQGERFNIMTSNIAEQLNKALREGRGSHIVELLTFIQRMMSRWFCARKKKDEKHRGVVSVEVDKQMTKNMATVRGSQIHSVTSWSSEIVGKFGKKHRVHLADKKCDCKYFDRIKIPCGHAMIAADGVGLPHDSLCGQWYKTIAWRETYSGVIYPEGDPRSVDIPDHVRDQVVYPPMTKRLAGRRRKNRIPSTGEYPAPKKKLVANKCGRCRVEGHNRTNCSNPI